MIPEKKLILFSKVNILQIQVLQQGSPATMDFRTDRVRIIVDSEGRVVGAPMTG